jgi:hypothetical protein
VQLQREQRAQRLERERSLQHHSGTIVSRQAQDVSRDDKAKNQCPNYVRQLILFHPSVCQRSPTPLLLRYFPQLCAATQAIRQSRSYQDSRWFSRPFSLLVEAEAGQQAGVVAIVKWRCSRRRDLQLQCERRAQRLDREAEPAASLGNYSLSVSPRREQR